MPKLNPEPIPASHGCQKRVSDRDPNALRGTVPQRSGMALPKAADGGVVRYHTPPPQAYFGVVDAADALRRGASSVPDPAARCIARMPRTRSTASAFT